MGCRHSQKHVNQSTMEVKGRKTFCWLLMRNLDSKLFLFLLLGIVLNDKGNYQYIKTSKGRFDFYDWIYLIIVSKTTNTNCLLQIYLGWGLYFCARFHNCYSYNIFPLRNKNVLMILSLSLLFFSSFFLRSYEL